MIIFYTSRTCHQHSNQWQCSIIVTCLRSVSRDQYTALSLERVLVTWYGRISYIYTFWYNFNAVLGQFLETGTSHSCLIGNVQLLRFIGFSHYPFHFSFIVPLRNYRRSFKYPFIGRVACSIHNVPDTRKSFVWSIMK